MDVWVRRSLKPGRKGKDMESFLVNLKEGLALFSRDLPILSLAFGFFLATVIQLVIGLNRGNDKKKATAIMLTFFVINPLAATLFIASPIIIASINQSLTSTPIIIGSLIYLWMLVVMDRLLSSKGFKKGSYSEIVSALEDGFLYAATTATMISIPVAVGIEYQSLLLAWVAAMITHIIVCILSIVFVLIIGAILGIFSPTFREEVRQRGYY